MLFSEPICPNPVINLLQPNNNVWSRSKFGLILLNAKNRERNLPRQPPSASLGKAISGKFIHHFRINALGIAMKEKMGCE